MNRVINCLNGFSLLVSINNNKWKVWKVEYRRHTNFTIESTISDLDGIITKL